jgi:hypothetical protein
VLQVSDEPTLNAANSKNTRANLVPVPLVKHAKIGRKGEIVLMGCGVQLIAYVLLFFSVEPRRANTLILSYDVSCSSRA